MGGPGRARLRQATARGWREVRRERKVLRARPVVNGRRLEQPRIRYAASIDQQHRRLPREPVVLQWPGGRSSMA
jgi:hypothetical protein